jgi:hypothetical protein
MPNILGLARWDLVLRQDAIRSGRLDPQQEMPET